MTEHIDPAVAIVTICALWLAVGYAMVTAWLKSSKEDDRG